MSNVSIDNHQAGCRVLFFIFLFFTWSLNSINLKEKCVLFWFFSVFVLFITQFVTRHAWLRHVLTGHKQINSFVEICIGSRCGWYATFTHKQQETTNHISKRKKRNGDGVIRPKFSSWSIDIYSHTSAVWRYSPRSLCQQLFNCRFHQLRCSWAKKSLFEWINNFFFFLIKL